MFTNGYASFVISVHVERHVKNQSSLDGEKIIWLRSCVEQFSSFVQKAGAKAVFAWGVVAIDQSWRQMLDCVSMMLVFIVEKGF